MVARIDETGPKTLNFASVTTFNSLATGGST
jgi:hypothetical protein